MSGDIKNTKTTRSGYTICLFEEEWDKGFKVTVSQRDSSLLLIQEFYKGYNKALDAFHRLQLVYK